MQKYSQHRGRGGVAAFEVTCEGRVASGRVSQDGEGKGQPSLPEQGKAAEISKEQQALLAGVAP